MNVNRKSIYKDFEVKTVIVCINMYELYLDEC